MKTLKITVMAAMVGLCSSTFAFSQITLFQPSYSPVVIPAPIAVPVAPIVPTYVAPTVRYAPVIPTPMVATPVRSSYRLPYTVARPVAPVVIAPAVGVPVTQYRPLVVGPGIGGLPNTYVPGQPVRNALRFAIP